MDTTILKELGFSEAEVKVYTCLISLGTATVGPLIDKTKLASSAVHRAIHSLIDKGLISFIKKGKIRRYRPAEPGVLTEIAERRKQNVLSLVQELEARQVKEDGERQEAEIYEGIKGITALLYELLADAKKGDEYLFFTMNVEEHNEEVQKFFQRYDMKRKEKGLRIRGLAPPTMKKLFSQRPLKMKFTEYPIAANLSMCNDKVALFSWGAKPVGYLITSRQIAEMFKSLFEGVWTLT